MVRKVREKEDIPSRQRWLYHLQEWGLVKAILFIWGIMVATFIVVMIILKWVLDYLEGR